jgi:hypothetical protein
MVIVSFLNDQTLHIKKDTILNGYKVTSDDSKKEYYLEKVYSNSINGEASRLSTVNPMIGIAGFIGTVDYFSVGNDPDNAILFKSSSIKSIRNQ